MKSGKSNELLARTKRYEYADKQVLYVQPEANTRERDIESRLGTKAIASTLRSLRDLDRPFDVIGIDEIHMFNEDDVPVIETWIKNGKNVVASGLDLDYRGKMMPIVMRLLELKPENTLNILAICDACKADNAAFTQILSEGLPILNGLSSVTVDDGNYDFEARCRDCFIKE
jgi:thymidine kinase